MSGSTADVVAGSVSGGSVDCDWGALIGHLARGMVSRMRDREREGKRASILFPPFPVLYWEVVLSLGRPPNPDRRVMNEAPLNHPGDETLLALSLGQLPEAELAQVSAHLSGCPACCLRIDQLATDD